MKKVVIDGKEYNIDIEKCEEMGLISEAFVYPTSWEEYQTIVKGKEGYQTYHDGSYDFGFSKTYHDCFNTMEEAEAYIALGKLINLRDAWIGSWKPDWTNYEQKKYVITSEDGRINKYIHLSCKTFLAFPTKEMRDSFCEIFKDLIEIAFKL